MMTAIHQPNYWPWLGYFRKMAKADIFVLLDNVQYSKNSYINRVQIRVAGGTPWLTVPISYRLGDPISAVEPLAWANHHLNKLKATYQHAQHFDCVWEQIQSLISVASSFTNLAALNTYLIRECARALGITCQIISASRIPVNGATGDDRLIAIMHAVNRGGTYLSGEGGKGYQDVEKFRQAGFTVQYVNNEHFAYPYAHLSVLDAVFHLGWTGAARVIRGNAA